MDIKLSFINYAEVLTECQHKGITQGREQERYLVKKILKNTVNSFTILDFIGADHIIKNPMHYQRILLDSFERYKKKTSGNLPIILFNINKRRCDKIRNACMKI